MLRSKFTTAMTLCAIFIPFAVLAGACTEGGLGSGAGSAGSAAGSDDSGTQGGEGSATGGASINGRLFAQTSVDIAAAAVTAP